MMKTIHVRESDLLRIIKNGTFEFPQAEKLDLDEEILLDVETATARAVVVSIYLHRVEVKVLEVQNKLFTAF